MNNLKYIYPCILQFNYRKTPRPIVFPLKCPAGNLTRSCPGSYPTTFDTEGKPAVCPDYFRWIHEDLKPWEATGISRDMVERAKGSAHFRLVIVKGKAYIEKYKKSIQTRDVFTIWGILQLLRRYPGKLPDLELMFDCDDRPVIKSDDYRGPNAAQAPPPPLFRYCGDPWTLDVVFPDWSFWGWYVISRSSTPISSFFLVLNSSQHQCIPIFIFKFIFSLYLERQ